MDLLIFLKRLGWRKTQPLGIITMENPKRIDGI